MIASRPRSLWWLPLAANLAACFNPSSYTPVLTFVAVGPSSGLQPDLVPVGTRRIFVMGLFFTPETTVYRNGRPQRTTYLPTLPPELSGTFFSAPVLRVELEEEATRVFGPLFLTAMSDDSLMSEPFGAFVVDGRPSLTGIDPIQIAAGSAETTIVLTGSGFNPTAQVFWNGNSLQTTFVSNSSLSATVPAAFLAAAGDAIVEVRERLCFSPDTAHCDTATLSIHFNVGAASEVVVVPSAASDLAWDATHSLLFAVIQQPTSDYALVTVDPRTGAVAAVVSVEAPSGLSVSDGDQFLYVGNNSSARRYVLPGVTDGIVFPNLSGARVAAAPGAPRIAAFSNGSSLRIVDDATVRPNAAQTFFEESISWGADSTKVYGISGSAAGIQTYSVDASGATRGTPLGSSSFPIQNDLVFDRVRRRIYAGGGENFDEQGGDPQPFPIAPADGCRLAIDASLGKAFFACAQFNPGLTVRSFDLRTQQRISSIVLSSSDYSTVLRMVRWGTDGLAVAVAGRIYLYSGQFVR
jgi:hypothetical protein